jgi:hypothetical protein
MTAPDLDALVEQARLDAAAQTSDAAAEAAVVALLAEADGSLTLAALLSAGAPRDAVARLCATPEDKRARPRARIGIVAGQPCVWLTSGGWSAASRPSAREVCPTSDSILHAQAPATVSAFLDQRRDTLARSGVAVRMTYGGAVQRRFSAEVIARAWAGLRTRPDAEGSLGMLTGGWLPDALVIESWPLTAAGRERYARSWGLPDPAGIDLDDLAETTLVCEIEDVRKAKDAARVKVSRCEAGLSLGLCRAVIWVCKTRSVASSLVALGVGDPARRPGQLLVPAVAVGLDGEDISAVGPLWWPLTVPEDPPKI